MTLGLAPGSALAAYGKRREQIDRWNRSATARESTVILNRPKRVNFADKCIFLAASASADKVQVSRMLRDGYDINEVDEDGITALHQACIEDNIEMVEFLLDHGADVNISDNEGWTPLHAVASCNFTSIAKVLLEQGANTAAINNDCCLPLDICKNEELRDLIKADLAAKGIDVGAARKAEELTMIQDVKTWGVNGYSEEPHPTTGATAMHVAACKGYIKVLDKLLKVGADSNACDCDGWTPLHAAAHWGQEEACRVLLDGRCDPTIMNNCHQTAFDVADLCVIPLLEQYQKKEETSKKRDARAGKMNLLPLPPKKSLRMNDSNGSGHLSTKRDNDVENRNVTTTTNSDDTNEVEEEEFGGSEAEDTVGDLPPSSIDPMDTNHGQCTSTLSSISTILSSNESQLQNNNRGGAKNYQDDSDTQVGSAPATREYKTTTTTCSEYFVKQTRDVFASTTGTSGFGDTAKNRKLGDGEKVSSSLPSLSSTSTGGTGGSVAVAGSSRDYLKTDGGAGDSEEGSAAWRRGGSLRTRTSSAATKEPTEEEQSNDRAGVRRTRSEATSSEVTLRRAYSFESDAKGVTFYSRLAEAKERLKDLAAQSASMSAELGQNDSAHSRTSAASRVPGTVTTTTTPATSTMTDMSTAERILALRTSRYDETTRQPSIGVLSLERRRTVPIPEAPPKTPRKYADEMESELLFNKALTSASNANSGSVVLRRKETESGRSSVPRPTTISSTNPSPIRLVPARSGEGESSSSGSTTPTTPSPTTAGKLGPVSKFKQFLIKSFVPPARDEESETQRKAHAKRVRETRRSTQGVTLEELKSAEEYVKSQQSNDTSTTDQTQECRPPTPTVVPLPTPTSTTNNSGPLRKEEDSLERRPSWRLRVDDMDRKKFSLEDLRTTAQPPTTTHPQPAGPKPNSEYSLATLLAETPNSTSSIRRHRSELKPRPPRPPEEKEEKGTVVSAGTPTNSEGNEVKEFSAKKRKPKRRSTGVVSYANTWSDEHDGAPAQSDTDGSRRGSDVEGGNTGTESRNENGIGGKINYKKLYEETLKENQQLKVRVSGLEEELNQIKNAIDRAPPPSRIGSDLSDKGEKRALEVKFKEMEDELKLSRSLGAENQKLKDENGALIRVISKLSK